MKANYDQIWITVPTYWGDYGTPENPPCIDFDHPTDLDGDETLTRTIDSLCNLPGDFHLLVVLAVTHDEYLEKATSRVRSILEPYKNSKKLHLVTPEDVNKLNAFLREPLLSMDSYGNIRNVQLFVPYCLGAEFVVGIDDDEIIEDMDYLEKIVDGLENADFAEGMAGPYFDRGGDYRLKGAEALGKLDNLFLKKNYFMNEALKEAMAKSPEIHPNVVAFGGNMIFSRLLIANVCHDPYIPRGEDYDYVINALMKGFGFGYHPTAGIIHLPPDSDGSQAGDNVRKLKADIRRFIYMSVKLEEHRKRFPEEEFDYSVLDPYPGAFAVDHNVLADFGRSALKDGYPGYMQTSEINAFVDKAVSDSSARCIEFFSYRDKWVSLMEGCSEREDMKSYLEKILVH